MDGTGEAVVYGGVVGVGVAVTGERVVRGVRPAPAGTVPVGAGVVAVGVGCGVGVFDPVRR